MLGEILNAGMKLIGGLMGQNEAENAAARQEYYARNAIQLRVKDAKKAGVSPIYALGASTSTPSFTAGAPLADAVSSMGADISRAVSANDTENGRISSLGKQMQGLQLTRASLENELLAAQIAKTKSQIGPPMPSPLAGSTSDPDAIGGINTPKGLDHVYDEAAYRAGGKNWPKYPGSSDAQKIEDRYGDIAEEIAGMNNMVGDWRYAYPSLAGYLREWLSENTKRRYFNIAGESRQQLQR